MVIPQVQKKQNKTKNQQQQQARGISDPKMVACWSQIRDHNGDTNLPSP